MTPVEVIRSFEGSPGASLVELPESFVLTIRRDNLSVLVTIPKDVLEWFVDARDDPTGRSVHDWCDYVGYDETPIDVLTADMAEDVQRFVEQLLKRPLRTVEWRGLIRKKLAVEWEHDGKWRTAIPFRPQDDDVSN
jgi:hypothetical protein